MNMKKYFTELVGTFFLVFVIGMSVISPGIGILAPLAIGSVLMAMVYAGGYISGAHYNPAVTLAVFIRGKIGLKDGIFYWLFQLIGGALAALLVNFFKADAVVTAITPNVLQALLIELIFTFALAYVVLNVATSKQTDGNSYYGLAIGFTLMVGVFVGGGISGGAYNPAVALGISLMKLSAWNNIWILLAGNLAGGILAGLAFRLLSPSK